MKKIIILVISCLLIIPTVTSAHTTLSSSTPSQGEVITSELHEVTLQFAGEIEKQSTITLTAGEKKVNVESITVEDSTLTGHITEPLENGDYTLTWNIVAKDGHLMTGDIPFTVNIEKDETEVVEEEAPVKEEPEQEQNQTNDNSEQKQEEDLTTPQEETKSKEEATTNDRSLISTISIIVLVILLAVGIGILFRKKR